MSTMELAESSERFSESMARAVSRAKELAVALQQPLFLQWAASLEGMRQTGITLAQSRGMSKFQIDTEIDQYKGKLAVQNDMKNGVVQ